MANIISNVLTRAEGIPESEDALFREDAKKRYATGDEVLKAAAEHFKTDQKRLAALVEHWRHINCKHVAIPGFVVPDPIRNATQCKVDLRRPVTMANIISNVLTRAEGIPESEDALFREDAKKRYATGDEVLKAAAEHFKTDQKRLAALVEHWRHINCKHVAIPGYAVPDAASSSATPSSSGREKGAREAADAIAAGTLKLKEYPPLPSPPGHQEYVKLLRERCGVGYEVPRLPPGVAEADFIQEVRGWNEAVKAKVKQKHGAGIFEQLHEEARKRWQEKVNPGGKR